MDMKDYTVLIIDDEYDKRRGTYEDFFEKNYRNNDMTFSIIPIQT